MKNSRRKGNLLTIKIKNINATISKRRAIEVVEVVVDIKRMKPKAEVVEEEAEVVIRNDNTMIIRAIK